MNPKPIIAMILTVLVVFIGFYAFSNKLDLKVFSTSQANEKISDARRNLPLETNIGSLSPLSFKFDTTKNVQNVEIVLNPKTMKINGQSIRSRTNESHVILSNFSGTIELGNGTVIAKGKSGDVRLPGYDLVGSNTVEIIGANIELSLQEVNGDYSFRSATGSFDVIANQSIQTFKLQNEPVEFRNYLGKITIRKAEIENVRLAGSVSKIILTDFTISKDY